MSATAQMTQQQLPAGLREVVSAEDPRGAALPGQTGRGGAAYLQHVEELRSEIEDAMRAISGNQLAVLEESLWRQQVLCTGLKHLSQTLAEEDAGGPLMERVREASTRLFEVNRAYAYLVQQSAGSTELLLRLTQSYGSGDGTNRGGMTPSWSCEA